MTKRHGLGEAGRGALLGPGCKDVNQETALNREGQPRKVVGRDINPLGRRPSNMTDKLTMRSRAERSP